MGKTIDSVTYYTDKGMITFDVPNVKVQTTTGIKATVADIMNTDTSAAVTFDQTLPADFQGTRRVYGSELRFPAQTENLLLELLHWEHTRLKLQMPAETTQLLSLNLQ